ncbi:MAG: polysaccharide biosynthesis tyrosine autokinase [Phototrophicaceae bacterium]
MVQFESVRQNTIDTLDLSLTTDVLKELVSTRILPGTTLLEISVTYTDPVLAADISNTMAEELIQASPSNLTEDQQLQVETARAQVEVLSNLLSSLQTQIDDINLEIEAVTNSRETQSLLAERNELIDQVNSTTANLIEFSQIITGLQKGVNVLEIVERAQIADQPDDANTLTQTLLGAIVSSGLVFGVVLMLDYLNDTLQSPNDVTALTNLPVLGTIATVGKKPARGERNYTEKLISNFRLGSKYVEDYYQLRANFNYASETNGLKIFVVSSPYPSEGKSVVTANLAIALGRIGKNVLIVDADLRRPSQHVIWNLHNRSGLSNLLRGQRMDKPISSELTNQEPGSLRDHIQRTDFEGVYVLTSGFEPSNPNEILGSLLVTRWAQSLKNSKTIDVVIFDSSPILAVSDSAVLARALSAGVIIVVEADRTRTNALLQTMERFSSIRDQMMGVVLNKVRVDRSQYYGYSYYEYYGSDKKVPINLKPKDKDQQPLENLEE